MVTILSAIIFLFPSIISSSAMADDFDITFKFERKHKCSNTSPKITLSNIPEGTQTFKARLVDRDVTSWNHGGGTVANDGSGVLGKGALTEGLARLRVCRGHQVLSRMRRARVTSRENHLLSPHR